MILPNPSRSGTLPHCPPSRPPGLTYVSLTDPQVFSIYRLEQYPRVPASGLQIAHTVVPCVCNMGMISLSQDKVGTSPQPAHIHPGISLLHPDLPSLNIVYFLLFPQASPPQRWGSAPILMPSPTCRLYKSEDLTVSLRKLNLPCLEAARLG